MKILLVEDDADVRQGLATFLAAAGYQVEEAIDGLEAFDVIARSGKPDLVLLDLVMPGMDGWEFIEEFRDDDQLAEVPIVVVTGARNACVQDVDAFLAKPIQGSDLLEVIREECG